MVCVIYSKFIFNINMFAIQNYKNTFNNMMYMNNKKRKKHLNNTKQLLLKVTFLEGEKIWRITTKS